MSRTKTAVEVLKTASGIIEYLHGLPVGSIDFRVGLDELQDCIDLLTDGLSDTTMEAVCDRTTNAELFALLTRA